MPPSQSFSARLLRSPVAISVEGLTIDQIEYYSSNHVTRWLNWIKTATPVEARQRGAINTRDDKLRQYAYKASLFEYARLLPGNKEYTDKIAIASTGPISEAYVGGGS